LALQTTPATAQLMFLYGTVLAPPQARAEPQPRRPERKKAARFTRGFLAT